MRTRLLMKFPALLGALCLAALSPTTAQDNPLDKLPKPGPEHKLLASLVGNFEAKVKGYFDPTKPFESTGTMKRTMVFDGRYLKEEFKGQMLGQPFQGMAIVGYDVMKKKYVNSWIDSMSTGFMLSEGSYDATSKTFTFLGEDFDPGSGKKMKSRDVLKVVSDEMHLFEMYRSSEGKEFKVMEVTYTRVKK